MALEEDFEAAQKRINSLDAPPGQDKLLALYGLYKQANSGDIQGKRPGMMDIRGRAKYDAWKAREGTSRQDAMRAYISLVDELSR